MRKLRLELEDLAVETFRTSGALSGSAGTVHGAEATATILCDSRITGPCCDITLALTCIRDQCVVLIP